MMRIETVDWELLLSTWGERWAWTLLHSLWQDGLLTIGLWLILRMLAARRADLRYSATLGAFVLAAVAPFVTWAWLGEATSETSPNQSVAARTAPSAVAPSTEQIPASPASDASAPFGSSPEPVVTHNEQRASISQKATADSRRLPFPRGVVHLILLTWGVGVAIQLLRTLRDLSATRTLLRGEGVLPLQLQASLARVIALLHLRRRFQVVLSAAQAGPFVFGLWKPTLVLPAALIAGLTPDQLEAVLLHELSHLRRYDDVINFIQLLVEAVFFFNPALGWISRELRRERETSCDARAVACLSSPLPLAEALARVAEGWTQRSPVPVPALGFVQDAEPGALFDRVSRILSPDHRPRLRLSWLALSGTIVLACVLVAGLQQATSWSVGWAKQWLSPAERIAAVAEAQKESGVQDADDPESKFVISGTIRAEDGGHLPERGMLHSWSRRESAGSSSSVGSTHGTVGDKFTVSMQQGRCWLIFTVEGFAPAIIGPLQAQGGQNLENVEVVLKRGVAGSVRVVDPQGRPVGNANIVASPDWGTGFWIGPSVPQSTDESGLWSSEHLADVPYRVSVRAAGFAPLEATESNRLTKGPLVISLEPVKPVIGVVVDADGNPVENARLHVISERRGNSYHYHGDSERAVARTRGDGKFELNELASETEYSVLVDAGDRGQAALPNVRTGMEQIRVALQKKLVLAGELRGGRALTAADGAVTVDCRSLIENTVWRQMSAKVDADGRFRFDGLFAGRYQLSIGPYSVSGRLSDSVNDLVVDLAELERTSGARDVEVRFTDHDKQVEPGGHVTAQMEVLDSRGQPKFGGSVPIVEGIVRLKMKAPGTLRLAAAGCQGYWFGDFSAEVSVGNDAFQAHVAVLPAGAIRVKVIFPDQRPGSESPVSASVQFRHQTPQGIRTESFSQNAVSTSEIVLGPVPLDTDCLVSATQGFRIVHDPILSLDGAEPVCELTLPFPKAVDAVVRVESPDGTPLPQIPIEVAYEPPLPPRVRTSGDLHPGAHGWSGDGQTTNRNGQMTLADMPENAAGYTVIARPKRDWQEARTEVRADGGITLLKLERGRVIEGHVIDQKTGRPVAGIEVRARPAGRPLGIFSELPAEAPTDVNGKFRFSNLPAQTVKLIVWGTTLPSQPEVEPGQSEPVTLRVQRAE